MGLKAATTISSEVASQCLFSLGLLETLRGAVGGLEVIQSWLEKVEGNKKLQQVCPHWGCVSTEVELVRSASKGHEECVILFQYG
ncbi:hypothetical protein CRG98_000898 [Punica granatum]|uniref:Uncharacterized protein n=1 Tax=Punica granatum TaxID=22663 RepID=A0A2I0LDB7_PUNGR|nr:hypothetical protein CRG98_000898 [Punica granatum]